MSRPSTYEDVILNPHMMRLVCAPLPRPFPINSWSNHARFVAAANTLKEIRR